MAFSTLDSDLYVNGSLTARSVVLPESSVTNASVQAAAGINASKLEHQHQPALVLSDHATDVAAVRKVIHRVKGATADIVDFRIGCTVAATSTGTATFQLKKNGSNILSAAITLDSGTAAFGTVAAAGYTSTELVAGDVLEVEVLTATGSTLPKGVFAALTVREDAA